jgi:hypothetical protein
MKIMKTTNNLLKLLIKEMIREETGIVWGTYDELNRSISAMDGDSIADKDYIDEETGEIYLDKGKMAKSSSLHPQYEVNAKINMQQDDQWGEEEDLIHEEDYRSKIQSEFDEAVREFVLETSDNEEMVDPAGMAFDIAEGFFHKYSNWRVWASVLELTKADIHSAVAEAVYEAMS